jgi:dipeptidyl aminopeptidase/acylaminoacyl peptidase
VTTIAPFGRWPSPLRAEQAAAGKVSLSDVCSDGTFLYWLESRPAEGGRIVFVGAHGDAVVDLSPQKVSIRSRVYEYGGGAVCLVPAAGSTSEPTLAAAPAPAPEPTPVPGPSPSAFAYVDLADQRVWLAGGVGVGAGGDVGGEPMALSEEPPAGQTWNHGGLQASADGAWVVAVREVLPSQPGQGGHDTPRRSIVALGTRADNAGASVLLEGHDFYGAPRLHPDGDRVAVAVWDHPDMQWDRSALVVAPIEALTDPADGHRSLVAAGPPWTVAGGPGEDEAVGQPAWRSDGSLRFVSDRRGWWQPYTHGGRPGGAPSRAMTSAEAEFHGADFVLSLSTMVELSDGTLVARQSSQGIDSLVSIRASTPGEPPRPLVQPCTFITGLCAHGEGVALIGTTPESPADVWVLPAPDRPPRRAVTATRSAPLAPADVAVAEPFALRGRSGRPVHGVFYPPTLGKTSGPPGELPPLVVHCHGGPTSAASAGFDVVTQYFTSRGFAVAAVDYAGSTGYGRVYRCSLWGQWGVADSEDCVDAAQFLVAERRVDGARLAVRGSSAGGLTALNALADGPTFRAAASWYGVTDLMALAASTHDFEAHYMDRLVGPLPESQVRYEQRSPVHRAAEIDGSVLLLQGLDDPVVPPAQAEGLRDALLAAGRHCRARFFAGESHGFRRAETLIACLEEELAFYQDELAL